MADTRYEVIDSDGHVIEPDAVWKEYAEPAYRAQLDQPGGGVQMLGMQRAYPEVFAAQGMSIESDAEGHWAGDVGGETWDEEARSRMGRPGGYDPQARLVDMDADGI